MYGTTLPGAGMMAGSPFLVMLLMAALVIIPFWFIFRKAGYSEWLSLLMVVPLVNVGMLYFLAFSNWPSRRQDAGQPGAGI